MQIYEIPDNNRNIFHGLSADFSWGLHAWLWGVYINSLTKISLTNLCKQLTISALSCSKIRWGGRSLPQSATVCMRVHSLDRRARFYGKSVHEGPPSGPWRTLPLIGLFCWSLYACIWGVCVNSIRKIILLIFHKRLTFNMLVSSGKGEPASGLERACGGAPSKNQGDCLQIVSTWLLASNAFNPNSKIFYLLLMCKNCCNLSWKILTLQRTMKVTSCLFVKFVLYTWNAPLGRGAFLFTRARLLC